MQTTTNEQFRVLLNADRETEHLEFKTAETGYNFNTGKKSLCGYATALANEGGGKLILGVTDKRPRIPIGTKAFPNTAKLEKDLFKQLRRRVRVEELFCQGKRVLIIHIPSRPIGEAIDFEGQYLMRLKDELLPMSPDTLKEIINEAVTDYSSKVLTDTNINDLDTSSIQELRKLLKNSTRVDKDIDQFTDEQMLQDLGLVEHKNLTIAALVLLGTETSLKKFLPHAEIRYGYKTDENQIRNQESIIFKWDIWVTTINYGKK